MPTFRQENIEIARSDFEQRKRELAVKKRVKKISELIEQIVACIGNSFTPSELKIWADLLKLYETEIEQFFVDYPNSRHPQMNFLMSRLASRRSVPTFTDSKVRAPSWKSTRDYLEYVTTSYFGHDFNLYINYQQKNHALSTTND